MTFGSAVDKIQANKRAVMYLPSWSREVKVKVQRPDSGSKMTHPYFYVDSRYGLVPWIPTMVEMFSTKWEVFDEQK